MTINVNGRQMEITATIREWVDSRLKALAEDPVLKTTQINVVLGREKNRFNASMVLNFKYHVFSAEVEDFDLGRAVEEAAGKLEAQARVLRDKIRSHKAEGLAECELNKVEEPPPPGESEA